MADVVNRGAYEGDETAGVDKLYSGFGKINTEFAKDFGATKIHTATEKATPVDADEFGYADSADTFKLKRFSWANIVTTLKAYFDTIYSVLTLGTSSTTAFRGDYGNTAYGHSQAAHQALITNGAVCITNTADWNTVTSVGFYMGSNGLANECTGTTFRFCIVMSYNADWVVQIMSNVGGTGLYARNRINTTWGSWIKIDIQPGDITKSEIEAKLTGEISTHSHPLNLGGYVFNSQTGTTYTFVLTDDGKMVRGNNASAQTYTIPPNSSVAFSTGTVITIEQTGAGIITIAPGSGVTVNSTARKTWGQYSTIQIYKISTDVWNVIGGTV
jgi:hypothetical protein